MAVDKQIYQDWEQLTEHVYRKWFDDNQIVVYKAFNASRKSVDAWADGIYSTYQTWDVSKPYLAVYDIAAIMTMTPYARARVKGLVETAMTRGIYGRYAIVIANSTISHIIRLFVRRELDQNSRGFVRDFFSEQEDALAWLRNYDRQG